MSTPGPALLWLRAVLLATVCVVLGASAHAAAMGSLPAPGTLGLLLVVTSGLCAWPLRRPSRGRRVVALSVTGQLWVHLTLAVATRDAHHASHHMAPMGVRETLVAHTVGDGATFAMLVLHCLAATLVGLWLAHGERLLWGLLAAAGGALLALLGWVPAVPRPPAAPAAPCPARPLPAHLVARCVVRRGPPPLLAG